MPSHGWIGDNLAIAGHDTTFFFQFLFYFYFYEWYNYIFILFCYLYDEKSDGTVHLKVAKTWVLNSQN